MLLSLPRPPARPKLFIADHPFYYMIKDKNNKQYFVGRFQTK